MKIAPGFSDAQWFDLTLNEFSDEGTWETAVHVLEARIYSRYIEPIDVLIEVEEELPAVERRFGFTILAIDLLLMETLQAFKEGLPDTSGKSKAIFLRFLEESPNFSKYFTTPESRVDFYQSFRCGILHQAEVQGTTLVWSVGELFSNSEMLQTVNRTEVHNALKNDVDEYLAALRNGDAALRENFIRKMNSIANRGTRN